MADITLPFLYYQFQNVDTHLYMLGTNSLIDTTPVVPP